MNLGNTLGNTAVLSAIRNFMLRLSKLISNRTNFCQPTAQVHEASDTFRGIFRPSFICDWSREYGVYLLFYSQRQTQS